MTMPLRGDFCSSNFIEMIKSSIQVKELNLKHTDINMRDYKGRNALYFAIESKNIDNVKFVIDSGSSLMVATQEHAMFHAVYCNDLDTIKLLVEKGIDVNMRDKDQRTPLMCASYYGKSEICNYLLEKEVNLFLMDSNHDMAIDFAYKTKSEGILNTLESYME